jgi:hypothetical protein
MKNLYLGSLIYSIIIMLSQVKVVEVVGIFTLHVLLPLFLAVPNFIACPCSM